MSESIRATFKDGVFVPEEAIDFPDGSMVEIAVELRASTRGESHDQEAGTREFLRRVSMRNILPGAPRHFTREELHERP